MMKYRYCGIPYEELPTMAARFAAIEEAQWMAEDEDNLPDGCPIPFLRDDPRFDYWVGRRNELRAEKGLPPLDVLNTIETAKGVVDITADVIADQKAEVA